VGRLDGREEGTAECVTRVGTTAETVAAEPDGRVKRPVEVPEAKRAELCMVVAREEANDEEETAEATDARMVLVVPLNGMSFNTCKVTCKALVAARPLLLIDDVSATIAMPEIVTEDASLLTALATAAMSKLEAVRSEVNVVAEVKPVK